MDLMNDKHSKCQRKHTFDLKYIPKIIVLTQARRRKKVYHMTASGTSWRTNLSSGRSWRSHSLNLWPLLRSSRHVSQAIIVTPDSLLHVFICLQARRWPSKTTQGGAPRRSMEASGERCRPGPVLYCTGMWSPSPTPRTKCINNPTQETVLTVTLRLVAHSCLMIRCQPALFSGVDRWSLVPLI